MVDAPWTDEEVPAYTAQLGLPGIVDTHVHFLPDRLQEAVWRWFDGLTPAWPITYRHSEQQRFETLAQLGVLHHTALAYAHRPGMLRFLNDHTLGLAARHEAVLATFTLYPEPGVADEVVRCLDLGGQVVKVHLQVGAFDTTDPLLTPAWARLEESATPVVLHAGAVEDGSGNEEFCGPAPVERLLEQHPDLQLVIAHMGAPDHDAFFAMAERHPTMRFDTAMVFTDPPHLGPSPLHLVDRLPGLQDRILFGSDFPTIPHAFAAQVRGLAQLDLGDDWMRAVLWHNAARLFGLPT